MSTVPKRRPDPLQPLADAFVAWFPPPSRDAAGDLDAAIRSAVRAILPGRQQKKNLDPVMQAARKAFVRTLRRRAISR